MLVKLVYGYESESVQPTRSTRYQSLPHPSSTKGARELFSPVAILIGGRIWVIPQKMIRNLGHVSLIYELCLALGLTGGSTLLRTRKMRAFLPLLIHSSLLCSSFWWIP